jgi:hypothetical protein
MFDVTYNGIPTNLLSYTNIDIPFIELTNSAGNFSLGIPFINISALFPSLGEIVTNTIVSTPNLLPDTTINIPIDNAVNSVKSVQIAGITYVPVTDLSELTAGTYYYNNITQTLTLLTTSTVSNLNQISLTVGNTTVINNLVDVPSFILQYNLSGSVTVNRSFEQHPTLNFSLICNKQQIGAINLLFSDYNKKYVFFGMPFRCNTRATKIKPLKKYPSGYYEINLSFQGYYQELLSKQVFVKQGTTTSTNTNSYDAPECQLNKPSTASSIGTSATNPNNATISLSTIASKAGFNYYGYQFQYEYPKNSPPDTTVSFSTALGDKPITKGLYMCYSNEAGVTTINWKGVPLHTVNDTLIFSEDLDEQKNLKPVEYNTIEISWDNEDETEDNDSEDNKNNKEPEFEYKPLATKVIKTGDTNPSTPPSNDKVIKTLDLCFDKSGPRKTYIETTYLGTTVVKQFVRIYGYQYTASEIYNSTSKQLLGNPTSLWKVVEETTTTYLIDPSTGYLLGNDIVGWKSGRYKQESDALETVTLTTIAEKVPYIYVRVPVKGATRYVLRQFRDVYLDAQNVYPYITYQACNPLTGKLEYRAKFDPSWVEPMFIAEEMTETASFNTIPDPANSTRSSSDPIKPPLIVGEQKIVRSKTKVYRSKNTTTLLALSKNGDLLSDLFIGDATNLPNEDKYTKYTSTFSAQDSGFNNSLEETKEEDSTGKPPQATKRESPYTRKSDDTAQLSETKKPDLKKPTEPTYKYILTTPPYSPYQPIQGSVSFSAKTQADALIAAKTQIEINDMQQNTQTSIDVLFNPYIVEGSRYYPTYGGQTYQMRVESNSSTLFIQGVDLFGKTVVTGKTTLTLGTDSNLGNSVQLTKIPQPTPPGDPSDSNNNGGLVSFSYVWNQGYELGTLVSLSTTTRTNF